MIFVTEEELERVVLAETSSLDKERERYLLCLQLLHLAQRVILPGNASAAKEAAGRERQGEQNK